MGIFWMNEDSGWRAFLRFVLFAPLMVLLGIAAAQETPPLKPCHIEAISFEGWQAQQISNAWVKLVIVPQIGGRVMQVYFLEHPYLFINSKFKGQYFPPVPAAKQHHWFNYGGDKIWPMPEGDDDEHHWPGPYSDPLDDGNYSFRALSQSPVCKVRIDGPPDPRTGLQYAREIALADDSPEIRFHAVMKNIADHPIQWAVQSVTQYDTKNPEHSGDYNRDFWAYTPANPRSAYLERFHVRAGLADDPSFRIKDGLFSLHWLPLENEVWLDSTEGWIAVMDAAAQFGMMEHFHYIPSGDYPGKATVIFYKNGSSVTLDDAGFPQLTTPHVEEPLRYMEAELNSPIVSLSPGQTYAMDTEWNPVRAGKEPVSVTAAGICFVALQATHSPQGVKLQGLFAVFISGHFEAELLDVSGNKLKSLALEAVNVEKPLELVQTITAPAEAVRVSVHLIDMHGNDHGELGSASIASGDRNL